jgi:hypothetical protein
VVRVLKLACSEALGSIPSREREGGKEKGRVVQREGGRGREGRREKKGREENGQESTGIGMHKRGRRIVFITLIFRATPHIHSEEPECSQEKD